MGQAQGSWLEEFRRRVPSLSFADKTLPCQPVLRMQFGGDEPAFHAALYDLLVRTAGLRSPVEEFDLKESAEVATTEMASTPLALRLLELLVLLRQPRRILEIGAFLGISAMVMARAMPPDGQLVTVEVSERFAELARENFRRNRLDAKISLIEGDAVEAVRRMDPSRPFDLIFLDADKDHYATYAVLLDPLVSDGGLLIADDAFFHGDVLNEEPTTSKGAGVKAFLEHAQRLTQYRKLLLPISTGMLLMVKQRSRA